jgi:hypothetical protein
MTMAHRYHGFGGGNTSRSGARKREPAGDTDFCRRRLDVHRTGFRLNKSAVFLAAACRRIMKQIPYAVALALALSAAAAQHAEHGTLEPAVRGIYAPRLGDLMILQQIRHAKLWFAVAAANWDLAEHQLNGLQDGFADIASLYPEMLGVAVAPVIDALKAGDLAELGKAIAAQDRVAFVQAFDRLTAGCNACHRTTRHDFIVIQQPISPPFSNQSFPPPRPGAGAMPGPGLHDHR